MFKLISSVGHVLNTSDKASQTEKPSITIAKCNVPTEIPFFKGLEVTLIYPSLSGQKGSSMQVKMELGAYSETKFYFVDESFNFFGARLRFIATPRQGDLILFREDR